MSGLPDDLNDLAGQLRRLPPAAPGIDRDNLFFRAGRASAPRPWAWQLLTALSTTCALALAATLFLRPPRTVERVVYVPVEVPAPQQAEEPAAPPTSSPPLYREPAPQPFSVLPYQQLQEHLTRWGLDGLGPPAEPTPPAPTLEELLDSL